MRSSGTRIRGGVAPLCQRRAGRRLSAALFPHRFPHPAGGPRFRDRPDLASAAGTCPAGSGGRGRAGRDGRCRGRAFHPALRAADAPYPEGDARPGRSGDRPERGPVGAFDQLSRNRGIGGRRRAGVSRSTAENRAVHDQACRQSFDDVPRAAFSRPVRRRCRGRLQGVEYLFPYDEPAARIRAELDEHGLEQILFNTPAGDWAAGDRGTGADPGRVAECREGIDKAVDYAVALGVPANPPDGRDQAIRARPGDLCRNLHRQPPICRRCRRAARGEHPGRGDQQQGRHARLCRRSQRAGAGHHRTGGAPEHPVPVRHLPHADHGGRSRPQHRASCSGTSPISSLPTIRAGTNPVPARSTMPGSCR